MRTKNNPLTKIRIAIMSLLLVAAFHTLLQAKTVSIGTQAGDFEVSDCNGRLHRLSELQGRIGTVAIFFGVECPIARLYGQRLCELADRYRDDVSVIAIDSNGRDEVSEIISWGREYAPTLSLFYDPNQQAADCLGATRNPEVVLIDRDQRIRYRGRIDDQYTTIARKDKVVRQDLLEAIEELLVGEPISVPVTIATGCYIDRRAPANAANENSVTYYQHIAPILRSRCVHCHRDGQSAPLQLTTYEQAYSWIDTIDEVIRERAIVNTCVLRF